MMNQFLLSVAADFAAAMGEPADELFDPLVAVLGKSPSQEDAVNALRKSMPRLTQQLADWLEQDLSEDYVTEIYRQSLKNFFGPGSDN
jgi:hypothetical protein